VLPENWLKPQFPGEIFAADLLQVLQWHLSYTVVIADAPYSGANAFNL
jgi:hypothetical protein